MQNPSAARGERLGNLRRQALHTFRRIPERRWQQLVGLVVLLWLTHSLAQLFWLFMPAPTIPAAQVSAHTLNRSGGTPQAPTVNVEQLRELTLFGAGAGDAEAELAQQPEQPLQPQIEDSAVDTKLSLVLNGIIGSSVDASARAIIADAKSQAIYGPGDEIENQRGVKVAKVLNMRVILDNNGQYESLWLYKVDPNMPRAQVRPQPAPANSRSRSRRATAAPSAASKATSQQGPLQKDDVSASVKQLGQNLSDVVAFNIHRENGKIKGYRIRPGRNPEVFNSVGLQAGDIVTAVNGTALDNPGKIMDIYRSLGQATSASLEIERDGDIVTVDIELE
jgi:general secretion pathway protein C